MGNLGDRERYGVMFLAIVVVVFAIYFFGIRTLDGKYDELVVKRQELQDQLDYYESLKTQNAATQAQIDELKTNIAEVEGTFLPVICAESIEQYVLKTFEDAGCPYLVSVEAQDVAADAVTLPNGNIASDSLILKRIVVQYSTTDGFNIPNYNRNTTVITNGVADEALWNEYISSMGWQGTAGIVGYNEFVNALKTIEAVDPDCIKINSISIKSEAGYILMTAEIDFYSATFNSRVSEPDMGAPYITWAGSTNINTTGGHIGQPFIFDDPNSEWFMVLMTDQDAIAGDRPFATYYSNAIFREAVNSQTLAGVLEAGAAPIPGADGEEVPEE
ncbi:MAG: hypothetical protein K6F79_00870 [Saccharofermentans sp.]|nr:hypothetical protein [Saccharofermentans sp.]